MVERQSWELEVGRSIRLTLIAEPKIEGYLG